MNDEAEFDVFVSYTRADRDVVAPLVDLLRSAGLRVWWDQEMPAGVEFQDFIPRALEGSAACVVFWTATSVESTWVRSEANRASAKKKLLAVEVDGVTPPPPFDAYNNVRATAESLVREPQDVLSKLRSGLELRLNRNPWRESERETPLEVSSTDYPHVEQLPAGAPVGNYKIIRFLGRGGFWIAYLAWDLRSANQVVLREGVAPGEGRRILADGRRIAGIPKRWLAYYEDRAQTATLIGHARKASLISAGLDAFEANGTWYVVSQYLRGQTLFELQAIAQREREKVSVLMLFEKLMGALECLHDLDYIHGDLKPSNIVVSGEIDTFLDSRRRGPANWDVHLVDFDTWTPLDASIRALTTAYAAPEALGGRSTFAVDIYSLGVCLFEWWTGRVRVGEVTVIMRPGQPIVEDTSPVAVWKELRSIARDRRERRLALSISAAVSRDPWLRPQKLVEWKTFILAGDPQLERRFKSALSVVPRAGRKRFPTALDPDTPTTPLRSGLISRAVIPWDAPTGTASP